MARAGVLPGVRPRMLREATERAQLRCGLRFLPARQHKNLNIFTKNGTGMRYICITALALLALPSGARAEVAGQVAISSESFDAAGARRFEFREVAGRQALCLDGLALLRGVSMREGAVVVDVAVTDDRQFGGIAFRARGVSDYEEAYLRLHKSRQPDAVQYAPVMGGEGNWQLFGAQQMAADLGRSGWATLRVDFAADRAVISVTGAGDTELVIEDLVLDDTGSKVGLSGIGGACFSNLRIADQAVFGRERIRPATPAETGTISEWALSPASLFSGFPPEPPSPAERWTLARTERDGLLLISRYRAKAVDTQTEKKPEHLVYASASLHSERNQRALLEFDASDRVRIYLNGEPLAEFDNTFRAKGPTFRGDFRSDRQRVFLPLKEGHNNLVLAVADTDHGWGLKGRIVSDDPVEVRPLQPTVPVEQEDS